MTSAVRTPVTLVDLLDRILDRGLVINADIVISLAGVPLIGINLRAALAGMETMTRYGLMQDLDRSIRASPAAARGDQHLAVEAMGRLPSWTAASPQGRQDWEDA